MLHKKLILYFFALLMAGISCRDEDDSEVLLQLTSVTIGSGALDLQDFSSNVERSTAERRLLRERGNEVHVFWLSGFIFFGSSNGLFERIKRAIELQRDKPVGYVVLDFSAVPGLDSNHRFDPPPPGPAGALGDAVKHVLDL